MNFLSGKYISILGASTSTFDGISNDGCTNSTLINNASYYPKDFMSDVNDTWWMKTVKELTTVPEQARYIMSSPMRDLRFSMPL